MSGVRVPRHAERKRIRRVFGRRLFSPGTSVTNSYVWLRYPRGPMSTWMPKEAWEFLAAPLTSPGFGLLVAPPRHGTELARTLAELPNAHGSLLHDLHTAVLRRERGVSRICTTDFHQFPFLTVVDPLKQAAETFHSTILLVRGGNTTSVWFYAESQLWMARRST